METVSAQRTLVKSPPELWEKLSDPVELARHLEEDFGEIRIARVDVERTVAWEGEQGRGTVQLEPSGWGTRVTLTAQTVAKAVPGAAEQVPAGPTAVQPTLESTRTGGTPALALLRRVGFLARVLGLGKPDQEGRAQKPTGAPDTTSGPVPTVPEREPQAAPTGPAPSERAAKLLENVLDELGAAHHRPFSRD